MAKRKKQRGYNSRAAREHPGVTISQEVRNGEKRILLRWREILPGGRLGKRKGCYALDANGKPAKSRTRAHAHAVRKAGELESERAALVNVAATPEYRPDATWAELFASHAAHLSRKGRSASTLRTYKQTWAFVESWRGRPALPKQLQLVDLEAFAQHVANHKKLRTQAEKDAGLPAETLSPHSVRTALIHLKGILNFGRKRLKCVRVDGETVAEGLQSPVKANVRPTALPASKLRQILEAASEHNGGSMFPLIAFLMVTGCRLGEAEALRWKPSKPGAAESWLDFDGGRILMYGVKTSRQRVIPFESRPALRTMLEAIKDNTDITGLPFVFGGRLPLAIRDKRAIVATDKDGNQIIGRSGKAALYAVRAKSGADWKPKDFRSTLATFMCNSALGLNVYTVAGELGHDHAVLVKHYAGQYQLPPAQRNATTVEALLGVTDLLQRGTKR